MVEVDLVCCVSDLVTFGGRDLCVDYSVVVLLNDFGFWERTGASSVRISVIVYECLRLGRSLGFVSSRVTFDRFGDAFWRRFERFREGEGSI